MSITYHIRPDGRGDFRSVSGALKAVRENDAAIPEHKESPVILKICDGIYSEQIVITRPQLVLAGQSPENTILTYGLSARMPMADIGKLGTFRSYSFMIQADDVTVCNLTIQNSSGCGPDVGQAIAAYADGNHLFFDRCRFMSGQDTLFTAPLPPEELEPNGFIGPGQSAPRRPGCHWYRNCYIEGDIDFIFGGAAAYFEACEFCSKTLSRNINSYVTAASTPRNQTYGYVMQSCRFTGNCPPHTAYLGRPWREYAKTVLLDCYIGSHICAQGWQDWNGRAAGGTVFYAEYQNYGPSADMNSRPHWVKMLTPAEAASYSRELVLCENGCWNPVLFEKLMSVVFE